MERATKTNNFEFYNKIAVLYEEWRIKGVEPIDVRNTILPLFFLSAANCQLNNDRSVVLPQGVFGVEFMESLKDTPAEEVCNMIDNALVSIENENFTPIECKSRPLTNICFGKLKQRYGTAIMVGYICDVVNVLTNRDFVDYINDSAYFIFVNLVEDFSKRFPEAAQYTTPHDIVEVMRELVWARREIEQQLPIRKTYDPACGVGKALTHCAGIEIYGQELNEVTYTLANMAMLLRGRRGRIALGDSLNAPKFWSEISGNEFDVAVSTPPLFISGWHKTDAYDDVYDWGVPSDHYGEWAFISQMLSSVNRENGMVCTVCSAGALFRAGEEQVIRKRVFEDNLVDAIVKLPHRSLYNSSVEIFIAVFRKGRKSGEGVLYLDLSTKYRRTKGRNVLNVDEDVDVRSIYANFLEGREVAVDGVAKVVKYANLKAELDKGNRLFLLQPFQPQEQEKPTYERVKAGLEKNLDELQARLQDCNKNMQKELRWLRDNQANS